MQKNKKIKNIKNNKQKMNNSLLINFLYFYIIYKIINCLSVHGKKDISIKIFKNLLILLKQKYINHDPYFILFYAIKKISPKYRLKGKRIAGKLYAIPLFLNLRQQINHGIILLIDSIKERQEMKGERDIIKVFFNELVDIINNNNRSFVLRRDKEIMSIAVENKYYVKYL